MDKITKRRQKKGVFLTLGITFLSLVILSLATLILKNAESSDDRLKELASYDKLYSIERSISDAYSTYNFDVGKFIVRMNYTNVNITKFTDGGLDNDVMSMVTAKLIFGYYLSIFHNAQIQHTLPDYSYLGLTFERSKSHQDVWYRYYYANVSEALQGVVNNTYLDILSFNESTVASLELVIKSNVMMFLNLSVKKKNETELGLPGSTVPNNKILFRIKLINGTGGAICMPPFPDTPACAPPNCPSECNCPLPLCQCGPGYSCDTWADITLSTNPQEPVLKQVYYLENVDQNPALRPLIVGGWLTPAPGNVFTKGAYIAVAPVNSSLEVSYVLHLRNPERVRVYDVAEANINLEDLGVRARGPIRIM